MSEIEWLTSVLRERRKREIYKGARKRGGNRGGKKTLKWPPAEIDRCITLLQRVSREKFGVNFLLDTALCTRCSRVLCNKFIQTDFLFVVNVLVQKAFGLSDINCITLNKPANIYVPRNKSSIHLAVGISCEKNFIFSISLRSEFGAQKKFLDNNIVYLSARIFFYLKSFSNNST